MRWQASHWILCAPAGYRLSRYRLEPQNGQRSTTMHLRPPTCQCTIRLQVCQRGARARATRPEHETSSDRGISDEVTHETGMFVETTGCRDRISWFARASPNAKGRTPSMGG